MSYGIAFKEMIKSIRGRENELRDARNYMVSLINAQSSILVSIDQDGVIDQFNNSARNFCEQNGIYPDKRMCWECFPFLDSKKEDILEFIASGDKDLEF